MTGLFDSAWLKWRWAGKHIERFERDLRLFAEGVSGKPEFTIRTEYHPKRHAFAIFVETMATLPPHWGLRIGDIAFTYRSALDHLAWAIVGQGRTPPDKLTRSEQGQVMFPITPTPQAFREALKRGRLPGALPADIAKVRRYQPYNRGVSRAPLQCLSILARLNNDDKHREIQPVLTVPTGLIYKVVNARNCVPRPGRRIGRAQVVEVGTEIGTVPVRRTGSNPTLEVNPELGTLVTLHNRVPVVQWYTNTSTWIKALLTEFSDPPPQIIDIARQP